jgi:hypothetical protein
MAKPIPEGFHSVTPYLVVRDAGGVIDFYKRALGAQEVMAGHQWTLATHKEDLTPEEVRKRAQAAMAAMGKPKT